MMSDEWKASCLSFITHHSAFIICSLARLILPRVAFTLAPDEVELSRLRLGK
jgi:hypothetical protein